MMRLLKNKQFLRNKQYLWNKQLLIVILMLIALSVISFASELSITLKDVYIGSSKYESGCIFDVNGQTAVVGYHETETVNGVTIYVQEVYAINTGTKDKDNCAFLYYVIGQPEARNELNIDESFLVNKERIGEEEVQFLLTTRNEYQNLVEHQDSLTNEYVETKEIPEQTKVTISGIDVTGTKEINKEQETDDAQREKDTGNKIESNTSQTFFSWLKDILFRYIR